MGINDLSQSITVKGVIIFSYKKWHFGIFTIFSVSKISPNRFSCYLAHIDNTTFYPLCAASDSVLNLPISFDVYYQQPKQAEVVPSKSIDQAMLNASKAHTPPPDHPWRKFNLKSNAPSKGDILTLSN